jgi:exopolyphosphatase/guanosine-5'-triphosphate,3'-diphosphate pyrophosphatase
LEERASNPCIGKDRADLVVIGGAIFDAVLRVWPAPRIRVADRGLREGVLMRLIAGQRL